MCLRPNTIPSNVAVPNERPSNELISLTRIGKACDTIEMEQGRMKARKFSQLVVAVLLAPAFLLLAGCPPVDSGKTDGEIDGIDLSVSVSGLSPVALNGTWSFDAAVKNGGTVDAGASTLEYVVNGTHTQVAVGPIAAGGSQTLHLSGAVTDLTSTPGTHDITVIADALNAVAETNEGNDTAAAAIPVIYPEIVIDTYDAFDPNLTQAVYSTDMELWKAGDASPLASDSALSIPRPRPPGWPYKFGAYIDYTGGMAPGTYYVRVGASSPGDQVEYGIRVIMAPNNSYAGWTFSTSVTDPGDTPLTAPVPFDPAQLSSYQTMQLGGGAYPDRLHRATSGTTDPDTGDVISYTVNWIKLILP